MPQMLKLLKLPSCRSSESGGSGASAGNRLYLSSVFSSGLHHHHLLQDDPHSVQAEDARAPPGVHLLLLPPSSAWRSKGGGEGRCGGGGPQPLRHPRHGGDRAQQEGQRPGLRGHPEAAHLRRRPRAAGYHAAPPKAVAGGDPEETGRCSGEEEVPGGGASETPGREEGARARSRSESFDQRAPGASRRCQQAAETDAPERLTGRGGQAHEGGVLMA